MKCACGNALFHVEKARGCCVGCDMKAHWRFVMALLCGWRSLGARVHHVTVAKRKVKA